jgi:putative DNA primase/helicase
MADFKIQSLVNKAKTKAAKDALEKAARGKGADLEALARQAIVSEDDKPPTLRRHIVNDATVEKLGMLLAENPNGLLTFRDELTGFLRTLDRQGHENDRGFYLEAWTGTNPYDYDRVERGSLFIPYVCLSLFGTIQPGPLARYIRETLSNNDGLISRFQLLVYPDPPRTWRNVDRYPDAGAKNRAFEVFREIDVLDPASLGAEIDEDRGVPFLRFCSEAQDLFDGWRCDLENRLRAGGDTPPVQSHLGKYRSLMPSLALLFHLVEEAGTGRLPPVSLWAAESAAAWCQLLERHALRVYQCALDGDPESAQRLAEHLKATLPNPFRSRDVIRKGWTSLTDLRDVEVALGILEDRNWLIARNVPSGASGGRPTLEYWIHPAVRQI